MKWLHRLLNRWRLRRYTEVGFVVDDGPSFAYCSRGTHSGGWVAPR